MKIYKCIDCMPKKPCEFRVDIGDDDTPTHCPIDNRCEVSWIEVTAKHNNSIKADA